MDPRHTKCRYLADDVLLEQIHHLLRLHRRSHILRRQIKIHERDLHTQRETDRHITGIYREGERQREKRQREKREIERDERDVNVDVVVANERKRINKRNRQTNGNTDRSTERQTGRHTDGHTDRDRENAI